MWILAQLEPGKGYKINLKLTALLCGFSLENTMLFDSHLHLDQLSDDNIQKTLGDSKITGMLAVSTNLKSAKKLLNLKQAYPEKLYIAAGFHPEQSLLNFSFINPGCNIVYKHRVFRTNWGRNRFFTL